MIEKEISKKLQFDGKLFRIWKAKIELPDGSITDREFFEHKAASVSAVVLDGDHNIYLVKEYRAGAGEIQIHLPGGAFNEDQETSKEAIIREVREETGFRPQKVEKLFELLGGGSWLWPQYGFLCTDLVKDPLEGDWDEAIEIIKIPFKNYLEGALDNKVARYGDFKAVILVAKKLGLLDLKA